MTVGRSESSNPITPTPVVLERAIGELRCALWNFEQALWDGNDGAISATRHALSDAIRSARRAGALAARLTPNLATVIGAQPTPAPEEASVA